MVSFFRPGGSDCVNLSAFSASVTTSVYNSFEQRILNLVCESRLRIFTSLASCRRAFCRKSRMSVICFGMVLKERQNVRRSDERNTKKHPALRPVRYNVSRASPSTRFLLRTIRTTLICKKSDFRTHTFCIWRTPTAATLCTTWPTTTSTLCGF